MLILVIPRLTKIVGNRKMQIVYYQESETKMLVKKILKSTIVTG